MRFTGTLVPAIYTSSRRSQTNALCDGGSACMSGAGRDLEVEVQWFRHFALHGAIDATTPARDHAHLRASAVVTSGISALWMSRYHGARIFPMFLARHAAKLHMLVRGEGSRGEHGALFNRSDCCNAGDRAALQHRIDTALR